MMKGKYRDRGTKGGRDSDRQDKAFALKAKGANRDTLDQNQKRIIIKDEKCI